MRNSFMSFAHYWFVRVSVDLNNWRMLNSVRDQRRLNLARRMAVRKRTGNTCLLCRTSKAKCSIFRPCSRFLQLQTVYCHNLQDKFADRNQAMQIQAALYVYNEQKGPSSAFRNFRAPPLSAAEVLMSPSSGLPSMQALNEFLMSIFSSWFINFIFLPKNAWFWIKWFKIKLPGYVTDIQFLSRSLHIRSQRLSFSRRSLRWTTIQNLVYHQMLLRQSRPSIGREFLLREEGCLLLKR